MIIENDRDMAKIISEYLKKEGFLVDRAPDEKNVLKTIKENYDLIIIDYEPPRNSGWNALEEVKQISSSSPVIMISAHGEEALKMKARELGVIHFFDKPFDLRKLMKVVKKMLPRRKSRK